MTKCETCTCIICKLSLVWYKRIYQRCLFLPWKRVAVWKQIAIKVNFLSILGSHNVLQFDRPQKASNFKTPPLFNLNVSTHSDALKNKRCTSLATGLRTLWKQQSIVGPLLAPRAWIPATVFEKWNLLYHFLRNDMHCIDIEIMT